MNATSITNYNDMWNTWRSSVDEQVCLYDEDNPPETAFEKLIYDAFQYKPIKDEKVVRQLIENAQKGDEEALDLIFKSNLRICLFIIRKYFGFTVQGDLYKEDIIQEANLGLLSAIYKFNLNYGKKVKFSSFAFRVIKNRILNFIKKVVSPISYACYDRELLKTVSFTNLQEYARHFISSSYLSCLIYHYDQYTKARIRKYVHSHLIEIISFEEHYDEIMRYLENEPSRSYVANINTSYYECYNNYGNFLKSVIRTKLGKKRFEAYFTYEKVFGFGNDITYKQIKDDPVKYTGLTHNHAKLIRSELRYLLEEDDYYECTRMLYLDLIQSGGYYERF